MIVRIDFEDRAKAKGKIVYQEFFRDHAEALETLGLSEQDAHADS